MVVIAGVRAASVVDPDPNLVSPGILGFLAFFLLAVALYLLLRNMNGHLRRMGYRAEKLEAEQAALERAANEPGGAEPAAHAVPVEQTEPAAHPVPAAQAVPAAHAEPAAQAVPAEAAEKAEQS